MRKDHPNPHCKIIHEGSQDLCDAQVEFSRAVARALAKRWVALPSSPEPELILPDSPRSTGEGH